MLTIRGSMLSKEDALLEQRSVTCKLCEAKFESLGDMQRHVLAEHMQKGDYQIPSEDIGK
jgi:hypothetical protein